MMKIRPGATFGIAVPIVVEVRSSPLRNKSWNSLHNNANVRKNKYISSQILEIERKLNYICLPSER